MNFSFFEHVVKVSTHTRENKLKKEQELYQAGNCIPCAISHVDSSKRLKIMLALQHHPPMQHTTGGMAVRAYEDWSVPNKSELFKLIPSKLIPACDGDYIVHAGGKGRPHAVFLRISDGGSSAS